MWNLENIIITPEMLSLIAEIDEFKGSWHLLRPLEPDRMKILRKVATIESVGSSTRIEGSKLSDREVELLLSNFDVSSFHSRDEQEVAGYAALCEEVFESFDSMCVSENIIKQLHGWLLRYSQKDQRHRGEYKTLSNNVEAFDASGRSLGIVFETVSPFETPLKMQALVFWMREQQESRHLHPLLLIGIFIVVFLAIHPFQDGNERLSRILTSLLLLKAGYLHIPYSSLESVIEQNKEPYYLALRRTQASLKSDNSDFGPWLTFFLRSLQKQKIHLAQKLSRETGLAQHLPALTGQILTLLRAHGRLGAADIEKMTEANRNTIKKHLAALVVKGSILRFGKGRATWYTLPHSTPHFL